MVRLHDKLDGLYSFSPSWLGITKKTKVDFRAGQHPVWDQEVRFPIVKSKNSRTRKLEVACYSQEPNPLPDQLLGKAVIDLTDMLQTGEFDGKNLTSSMIFSTYLPQSGSNWT